jgi:hypothetical protein
MKMFRAAVVACIVLVASVASAQTTPAPQAPQDNKHQRSGFWFSGGLGFGSASCEDCGERFSGGTADISLGGTINPKFLIGVGLSGFAGELDGFDVEMSTFDARIRFYPSVKNGFFITGGIGTGRVAVEDISDNGLAVILGIGYDARVGKNVSITPFWNGYGMSINDYGYNFGTIGVAVTIH